MRYSYYCIIFLYKIDFVFTAARLLEDKLDLVNSTVGTGGMDYLESPVSDGTIEENFEEALVDAPVIESGVWPFTFC